MSNARPLKPRALLLDTCIWVNAQFGDSAGHKDALDLITAAYDQGVRLGIAPHSLSNVFYITHRHLKRLAAESASGLTEGLALAAKEAAWGVVDNIMEYAEVVGSDVSDAHIAALHKRVHNDFEDNLVMAAARRMDADLIVTDDLAFIRHCPLPAMSAHDALNWLGVSQGT